MQTTSKRQRLNDYGGMTGSFVDAILLELPLEIWKMIWSLLPFKSNVSVLIFVNKHFMAITIDYLHEYFALAPFILLSTCEDSTIVQQCRLYHTLNELEFSLDMDCNGSKLEEIVQYNVDEGNSIEPETFTFFQFFQVLYKARDVLNKLGSEWDHHYKMRVGSQCYNGHSLTYIALLWKHDNKKISHEGFDVYI